jgi:hypothetical protein
MRYLPIHLALVLNLILSFHLASVPASSALGQVSDLTQLCQDPAFRDAMGPALSSTLQYPLTMSSADECVRILTTSVMLTPYSPSFTTVCEAPELRPFFSSVEQCVAFFNGIDA